MTSEWKRGNTSVDVRFCSFRQVFEIDRMSSLPIRSRKLVLLLRSLENLGRFSDIRDKLRRLIYHNLDLGSVFGRSVVKHRRDYSRTMRGISLATEFQQENTDSKIDLLSITELTQSL